MKNCKAYLPLALILLLVALAFTACGNSDGGTTAPGTTAPAPTEFTISFSVNGVVTTQTVAAGEIPVFEGSTEKAYDIKGKKYYAFDGWDKPLTAATENTTYTAQYRELPLCTVMWDVQGGLQKSYTGEGMIPTPPANTLETKLTNDTVRTFLRWDKEITAATTGVNLYKAVYSDSTRYYTVSFRVNGTEVATGKSEYNQLAYKAYAGGAKLPAGYGDIMWFDGNFKVTNDTAVVNGAYVATNGTVLTMSYLEPLLGYTAAANVDDNAVSVYASASAVIHMLHEIRATRNADSTTELLANLCADHLKNLVNAPGAAPHFDLTANWAYVPLTGSILIAKQTPAVWDKLSALEKEKLDFAMEVFAYIFALGTDDNNDYRTGPGMMGNFRKLWNPNYRLANVIPMLFIGKYFGGAAKVNQMLHAFSYDDVVAKFQQYGFTRAYVNWTRPDPIHPTTGKTLPGTKTFMENGGPAYTKFREELVGTRLEIADGGEAGSGVGVRTDYTYDGCTVDEVGKIVKKVFGYTYSGGSVISSVDSDRDGTVDAYIFDETKSPYEGLMGMMLEFNNGGRSSAAYCSHDFMMVVTILFVLEELELYDTSEDITLQHMIWIGNQDFLYKYQHGYMSVSGYSKPTIENESTAADYYHIWKLTWLSGLGGVKLEDLPVPEAGFNPVIVDEDFSETTLNLVEPGNNTVGRITFANKAGSAMKTESDTDGNTYLRFTQAANAADPLINMVNDPGGLADLVGEYSTVIFSVDLARLPGVEIPLSVMRLRGTGTSDTVTILSTDGNGAVAMRGTQLTTLTEDFQTISVKVDFEAGTLTGYVNGTEVATATLSVPSISKATTTAEWLNTLTTYILNWQIQAPSGVDRALLIDNINVFVVVPD